MGKKYFLILIVFIFFYQQNGVCQKLSAKKELINIELNKGLNYFPFAVNENYLAFGEFYSGTITIYGLKTEQLDKLKLKKGRGPHEYQIFTSLSLTDDAHLIVADPENAKLINYNISSQSFLSDLVFSDFQPYRISAINRFIYSLNKSFFNNNSLFALIDLKKKDGKISPVKMNNLNVSEEFSYPFKREGFIAVNSIYGIFISRYYPNLYLSNIKEKNFLRKIRFDDWQTEKGDKAKMRGKEFYLAPTDVDVKIKDVSTIPGSKNSVAILAKGKSKNRSYSHSQLRVFNFQKEKFTETLDFGFEVDQIVANSNHIFVYSKEENAIFRYKITSD